MVRTYLNELALLSTGVNMGNYDIYTFGRLFGDVTIDAEANISHKISDDI